jgi:hypothetical protein
METLAKRRLGRAYRRALEAGASPDLSPVTLLEAAESASESNPFALAGVGRVDPFAHLVKP